jgi:membrane protein
MPAVARRSEARAASGRKITIVRFLRRIWLWLETSDAAIAHWIRAAHDALFGEMPVLAAGTALFAILATVPTLAAVVGVYGLVADPHQIQGHLRGLQSVLPPEVVVFVGDQLERQAKRSSGELGLAIATSIVVAVYSARGAARALIAVLNRAYRVRERRHPVHNFLISLGMAGATLIGLMVMFGAVVALPGIFALLHLSDFALVSWLRWPILMAMLYAALLLLYRYGPSPRQLGTDRHLWPGALTATLLLMIVSWGLSQWVEQVSNYELFYGAFGSVVVVLLWFYLSTIALVLGGFINAELERYAGAPAPDRSMY